MDYIGIDSVFFSLTFLELTVVLLVHNEGGQSNCYCVLADYFLFC